MIVDSQLVAKLSARYKSKGQMADAYSLRVEQADYLNRIGAVTAARDVFKPIEKQVKPDGVDDQIEQKRTRLEDNFKTQIKLPPELFPGGGFGKGDGFGRLIPGAVNFGPKAPKEPTRWLRVGNPEVVAIWYPADAGFTKEELSKSMTALEQLVAYNRKNTAGSKSVEAVKGRPQEQLGTLPDWVPSDILQVESEGDRGRLVVDHDGDKMELRFEAPGSSEFQYVRFDKGPDLTDARPRVNLRWNSAANAKCPASRDREQPTVIFFKNATRQHVMVYWVDFDARRSRSPHAKLAPGETRRQETGAGHAWLVTNDKGQSLGFFVAVDAPALAKIEKIETAPDFSNVQPKVNLRWITVDKARCPPSRRSTKQSLIVFENRSRQTVLISWSDYNGRSVGTERLAPGRTSRKETRSGSTWRVTDVNRRELGHFVAVDQPARASILAIKKKPDPDPRADKKVTLKWIRVAQAKAPPSRRSIKRTQIVFENASRQSVLIYSVDLAGKRARRPSGRLAPGRTMQQETRSGSSWMVTDNKSRELGHFVAVDQPGRAKILSTPVRRSPGSR